MATDDSDSGPDDGTLSSAGETRASESDADTSEPEGEPDADGETDRPRDSDADPVGATPDPTAEDGTDHPQSAVVGEYGWSDFKREYYYDEEGNPPEDEEFDPEAYLGFDPSEIGTRLNAGGDAAELLLELEAERTVRVDPKIDEDEFFRNDDGTTTVVTRYDLEKAVPQEKKSHFREVDRYWVNKPYAFVIIFHSEKENEKKYYLVEPHLTEIEAELREFLVGKLKTAIKYSDDDVVVEGGTEDRASVIENETHELLDRYDLYAPGARPDGGGLFAPIRQRFSRNADGEGGRGTRRFSSFSPRSRARVAMESVGKRIGRGNNTDSDRDTENGSASERGDDSEHGADVDSEPERKTDTDSNADTDTSHETDTDTDTDSNADTETDTDTEADGEADAPTETTTPASTEGTLESIRGLADLDADGVIGSVGDLLEFDTGRGSDEEGPDDLQGISARPEPAVIEESSKTLTEHQIEKLLYFLKRDFVGFERIDGIKHDINVEDISCDGYESPVFVYHSEYEQIISNVYHGTDELDEFVVKLAQRSGKGISKRSPQVDATLPDGSRAQLTLGREVSDHGTNYTIRQFKDVPFTPIDLINWNTFSLEEMAFLWLSIENKKSVVFAGGTASGKTTSLNAVSLFIPSKAKIVSIEDTREVELPQRNWIASVTRPSFSEGDKGDVDEFDLLEAALRQRPEYIVMGEIRGEEGRTLFQVMSTGHTTLTTFHADSVGEVIKRFTTEPINVSKTMFTALDLVSIQTQTRVQDNKVRRNKSITEINHYDPENDEINVQDVYQWQAERDEFIQMGDSNTLDGIAFDRGWHRERIESELYARQIVLAYLINRGLNTYTQVAATLQAFLNDPESILALIATDDLEASLEDLREMESVEIDIDPEKEEMVPRPEASEVMLEETEAILEGAEPVLAEYRDTETDPDLVDALDVEAADDIDVTGTMTDDLGGGDAENAFTLGLDVGSDDEASEDGTPDSGGAGVPDMDEFSFDGDDESEP